MSRLLLWGLIAPSCLFAKPQGLHVHKGHAEQHVHSQSIDIHNSPDAILHWEDFSIDAGETVRFIQPKDSSVLNRVTGPQVSQIHGLLQSEGTVFLINPNGIFIGGSGIVQTGGFIASTADITDKNLMKFDSSGDGKIVNQGRIQCPNGKVYLVANTIENEGVIDGYHVEVTALIKPRIMVRANVEEIVSNPYAAAIRQKGHIQAKSCTLTSEGDVIIEGSMVAQEMHVEGQEMVVSEQAYLDVSETLSMHGENIHAKGTLVADGENGGKIMVVSENNTYFSGELSAIGKNGDGGFAEVSGKVGLRVENHPDLRGFWGTDGLLVLDPGSVNIVSGGNVAPPASMDSFNDGWINDQLQNVSSLTISTANSTNGGIETLTVNGTVAISWTGSNSLTLIGGRNAVVSSGATIECTSGSGGIEIQGNANAGGDFHGIDINNAMLSTDDGSITLTGTGGDTASDFGMYIRSGTNITATNGLISITGIGGIGGGSDQGVVIDAASSVTTANGALSISGTGRGSGNNAFGISLDGQIQSTGAGSILLTGDSTASGAGNNGIYFLGGQVLSTGTGSITLVGHASNNASGNSRGVFLNGNASISSNSSAIHVTGTGGGIGVNNHGILIAGTSSITSPTGLISLIGTGSQMIGAINGDGVAIINTSSVTTGNGPLTIHGVSSEQSAQGITIESLVESTGSGSISITGQGINPGTYISGQVLSSGSGSIDITGSGSNAGNPTVGLFLTGTSLISTVSGDINLKGSGGGAISGNNGNGTWIIGMVESTGSGAISIQGKSTAVGGQHNGIFISVGGQVLSSGTGEISLSGDGSPNGTFTCSGILISAGIVSSGSGNVQIHGVASGASAHNNAGFRIGVGGSISTSSGTLQITGTGSESGTSNAHGIWILDPSSISTIDGSIVMEGTSRTTSSSGIKNLGSISSSGMGSISLNGMGTGASNSGTDITSGGTVTCTGNGSITLRGTAVSGAAGVAGVEVEGLGSLVSTTNGNITIIGNEADSVTAVSVSNSGMVTTTGTGNISITGNKSNINGFRSIQMDNAGTVSTSNGSISLNGNQTIELLTGSLVSSTGSGTISINPGLDLIVAGSVGTPTFINPTFGTLSCNIGRDLLITAGTGAGAEAQIGNHGLANATSSMTFNVSGNVNLTPNGSNYAVIGHGVPTLAQTLSGNITFSNVAGTINVLGGPNSFAQIGHINATTGGSTLGGNILMLAGNINVLGGSGATGFARIGHGGQAGAATYNPHFMQLIANNDIEITSNVGEAQVVNSNGSLTLVVDNQVPTPYSYGPGRFTLNSLLSATGELRIYTAARSQNTINDLINGVVFVPGPYAVNTSSEQWYTYFPGGTYGGFLFKIYYKEPNVLEEAARLISKNIAANMVELSDLLPSSQVQRIPFVFPSYHFQVCEEGVCVPTLSPYGSFIFEDDVWWIGEER